MAFAVPSAAKRRSFVHGRAARTNGRIWVRMIGSVSRRNGVTAALVAGSLRIGGRSDSSELRSTGANRCTSPSARVGGVQRARQPRHRRRRSAVSSLGERVEHRVRRGHEPAQVLRMLAELGHQEAVVVDQLLQLRRAAAARRAASPGRGRGGSARGGGTPRAGRRRGSAGPSRLRSPAASGTGACRRRAPSRSRRGRCPAACSPPGCVPPSGTGLPCARIHLDEHVLQRGLRPQQRGRVLRGSGSRTPA